MQLIILNNCCCGVSTFIQVKTETNLMNARSEGTSWFLDNLDKVSQKKGMGIFQIVSKR